MKSEEIKAQIDALAKEIQRLKSDLSGLVASYEASITDESPFSVGDKVMLTENGKQQICVFDGYFMDYGTIKPLLWKAKKDGQKSSVRFYFYDWMKMEKI